MAERKVLNKYYPPDYDPSKLRSFEKKSVRKMCNVRMMLPMTVRCYTCNNYMYIGTKFNMKVETVQDEDYLGINVYRFYFKCTTCYSEITFKTDPKNNDYVAERGASRNHEPWKDMLMAEEEYKAMKKQEMKDDPMKSLEYRTYDSKREMDILDAIDQVKTLNRRESNVNYDELIKKVVHEEEKINEFVLRERQEIIKKFEERANLQSKELQTFEDDKINLIDNGMNIESSLFMLAKKVKRNQHESLNNIDDKDRSIIKQKINEGDNEEEEEDNKKKSDKETKINDIFKIPTNGFSKYKMYFKKKSNQ